MFIVSFREDKVDVQNSTEPCKPFKEPRNRFLAWQAGAKTLFDVPAPSLHRLVESIPEPVLVNLLRSPGIDFQPGRPVRQPYLTYRPARLYRLAKSIPRNRFLGSLNVYKFGLCCPAVSGHIVHHPWDVSYKGFMIPKKRTGTQPSRLRMNSSRIHSP
jgi:hypothetical protein